MIGFMQKAKLKTPRENSAAQNARADGESLAANPVFFNCRLVMAKRPVPDFAVTPVTALRYNHELGGFNMALGAGSTPTRSSSRASKLIAFGVIAIVALTAGVAEACPSGSRFFAWGGSGGCVANGKQVTKCYNMSRCP
jgi:hypothetical protein